MSMGTRRYYEMLECRTRGYTCTLGSIQEESNNEMDLEKSRRQNHLERDRITANKPGALKRNIVVNRIKTGSDNITMASCVDVVIQRRKLAM